MTCRIVACAVRGSVVRRFGWVERSRRFCWEGGITYSDGRDIGD